MQLIVDKDKSFSIHPQNLQVLATDMYKVYSNILPWLYEISLKFQLISKTSQTISLYPFTTSVKMLHSQMHDIVS